jgi:DNA processing protein
MKYLNALYIIPGVGSETLRKLFATFQSGEAIWQASTSQMQSCGISQALAEKITTSRGSIDPEKEWAKILQEEIVVLSFYDDLYPPPLKEIPSSPFLIYCRGNLDCLLLPSIAIVGSRKMTPYGKQTAEKFSYELARDGICIVSGLALGIDAEAHSGALEASGKTIAVMANGIDNASIYPRNNYNLAQEILSKDGLIMSEFPLGTPPTAGTFPARDRIMAGLTLGTLVIEAAEKSGSLITPSHAVEFNREVFAIPGSIFSPQSIGTNKLIKKGAKIVTSITDIFEELRLNSSPKKQIEIELKNLTEEEKMITYVLSPDPTHIDRIIKLTKLETSCVISNLSMLEIKGAIRNIGGQNYIRL